MYDNELGETFANLAEALAAAADQPSWKEARKLLMVAAEQADDLGRHVTSGFYHPGISTYQDKKRGYY